MAIYRPVHISFWQDDFVIELTKEQRYFYLYLMTNSKTKQSGVYEIPKNLVCFETGCSMEEVDQLLDFFAKKNKIIYDESTKEILIVNWIKYNPCNSRNISNCVISEIKNLKSSKLKKNFLIFFENFNKGIGREKNKETKQYEDIDFTSITLSPLQAPIKGVKAKTKTESKEETESSTESQSKEELESVKEIWNSFARQNKLSEIKVINGDRLTKLRRRLKNPLFKIFDILEMVKISDFLLGKKTNWKISFDFIIENETNYLKILEGNYKNGASEKSQPPRVGDNQDRERNESFLAKLIGQDEIHSAGEGTDRISVN